MNETPDDAEIDYAYLTQDALRGVVREVLSMTKALGMPPGEHHFYIEFATHGAGVSIPDHLKAQYPERMTIVLQHQFEGLEIDEEGFAVTLHFGGSPAHLVVPFAAVTQFADPSASFALQFAAPLGATMPTDDGADDEDGHERPSAEVSSLRLATADDAPAKPDADADGDPDDTPPAGGPDGSGGGGGADVVSLDRFRKK